MAGVWNEYRFHTPPGTEAMNVYNIYTPIGVVEGNPAAIAYNWTIGFNSIPHSLACLQVWEQANFTTNGRKDGFSWFPANNEFGKAGRHLSSVRGAKYALKRRSRPEVTELYS